MTVERVGLVIPDGVEELIKSGKIIRTNGILRNVDTMEILKHLEIVDLDVENCWKELSKAVSRVIKENKVGTAIVLSVVVAGSVGIGAYAYNKRKKDNETEEKYNAWVNKTIQNYINEAEKGSLNANTICDCEEALTSLPHITNKVFVSMTTEQINEFTKGLKEYTEKLAILRNYEITNIKELELDNNVVTCLLNNLRIQKEIIGRVA